MRNNTNERAAINRRMKPERAAFLVEFPRCWNCGKSPTTCDEMVSGMSGRVVGVQHRLAWLALCWDCNCNVLNGSAPEIIKQKMALKWVYDHRYFDREQTNVLRGFDKDAVTMSELIPAICRILAAGRVA